MISMNTNLPAMDTLRNLNNTSMMLGGSIQRLSSGLRINSAADDPAGLIISQKFQAQLSGIAQALSNTQDSINYVKTADGALGQISTLLQSARGLAVQSNNTGVISNDQAQADNVQLQSIISSITRISTTTQFGTKYLLNGSAGTSSAVTDGTDVQSLNVGGTFGGQSLSAAGTATLTVTAAATQAVATLTGTFNTIGSTVARAGSFTVNGVTFNATAADTAQTLINKINGAAAQTGVTASYDSVGKTLVLNSSNYGSGSTINVADANGVVLSAAGSQTANGTDATATVKIGSTTVNFTGGISGNDGLTLTDSDGNTIRLTNAGNSTSVANKVVGQITPGNAIFQVGGNAGQTVNLSIQNFAASQLGTNAVAGQNLSTLDLTTGAGSNTALQVIDSAINQVASLRGQLGAFQADVLQTNVNVLGIAQENLSASNSQILDVNVAAEMTKYTQLQVLQQAGMSVLGQANSSAQSILSLIKGG